MKQNWGTSSGFVSKSKMHRSYKKIFGENTVVALRIKARLVGESKWYSLRKPHLVSAIVTHESALVITEFFRQIVHKKMLELIKTAVENGSRCPVSLSPISDMKSDDIFVHNGLVFCKSAVLDYVKISVDFTNPITRTALHLHDVKRLESQEALKIYEDRTNLRRSKVKSINQFAFLELELDNVFRILMQNCFFKGNYFEHNYAAFKRMWKEMKSIDKNRTICVLKSLEQCARSYSGESQNWGLTFLEKYLTRSKK